MLLHLLTEHLHLLRLRARDVPQDHLQGHPGAPAQLCQAEDCRGLGEVNNSALLTSLHSCLRPIPAYLSTDNGLHNRSKLLLNVVIPAESGQQLLVK